MHTRLAQGTGVCAEDRIVTDHAGMVSLPPVAPKVGWRASTRLARDHYVRIDSNHYSVHPAVIGRDRDLGFTRHDRVGWSRTVPGRRPGWASGRAT